MLAKVLERVLVGAADSALVRLGQALLDLDVAVVKVQTEWRRFTIAISDHGKKRERDLVKKTTPSREWVSLLRLVDLSGSGDSFRTLNGPGEAFGAYKGGHFGHHDLAALVEEGFNILVVVQNGPVQNGLPKVQRLL